MKTKLTILSVILAGFACLYSAAAQGTAFTYQGRLNFNGAAANGFYDFEFSLYNEASTNGTKIGSTLSSTGLGVTNGLFTTSLDFGAVYSGSATWLAISVRSNNAGSYTLVTPLQELTPTPYSIYAESVGTAAALSTGVAVGQGYDNSVGPNSTDSFIGGGVSNIIYPNFTYSTIGGGSGNYIETDGAVIAGGGTDGGNFAPNVATGPASVIGGGLNNINSGYSATIAGGSGNNASGSFSAIGGGAVNVASANGAVIGGGGTDGTNFQPNTATGLVSFIGGGLNNSASGSYTTVGGGAGNVASGNGATIAGGGTEGDFNIGNGADGAGSFIGGGSANYNDSFGGVIVGGIANFASGDYSMIGGGFGNSMNGVGAVIGGGGLDDTNFVGNSADGVASVIGGGLGNNTDASAYCAMIPGGSSNVVSGAFGFAAGHQAQALHEGAFVWADSQNAPFASTAENQFSARAQGGVVFTSGSGAANQTVSWSPGAGSWSFSSDRNLKDRFAPVDDAAVLDKVAKLPLAEWSYKGYGQRHIGAMAQDFHALFPLNDNDKVLNDADLHGVELAAIKGLNEKLEEQNRRKDAEIQALQAKVNQTDLLEKRLRALEQLVQSLAPANK